ncbi:MAG: hypothetical protein DMG28_05160 [Acidobacteria bacterium]|nr:MAG: hypothetical protein DMG28_05160 [Acidobacteriota bacterium]
MGAHVWLWARHFVLARGLPAGLARSEAGDGEVLGIGRRTKIDKLEIRWPQPSGRRVDVFTELPVDRYISIIEGSGIK